eukprot:203882-Chlamydomonas_euryale.AAC.1
MTCLQRIPAAELLVVVVAAAGDLACSPHTHPCTTLPTHTPTPFHTPTTLPSPDQHHLGPAPQHPDRSPLPCSHTFVRPFSR